ncbi:metal ABC transporter substrate-binding protein [Moraxella haemolytica]|uniref:metal ABC transporter substrate-binding protein n=1 Tax=Moraxella TaxID=475 RepID=UPI002543E8BA|nr:metal ABC transporter substrate-binding protein [Moraxella sp. ZY171148]WII95642.1 metal ABC transporter substrate-binding protein [Moraxella sp. ZY171148]
MINNSLKKMLPAFIGSVLLLTACGADKPAEQSKDTLSVQKDKMMVVTTFTIIADIAQNVAGDVADVESITKAGAEIHDYEPTPKDIAKVKEADLILHNGMNLERWFDKFYQDAKDTPEVVVTEGITPLMIKAGSYKDLPNPHAWMSPTNALIYVENIKNALIAHDPKNKDIYIKNAEVYRQKIKALDEPLRAKFASIPKAQRWLVTSEGAFSYLAKDYGLNEAYLWDINAEQQGTPKQVRTLIETIKTHKIPVVFSESTISDKPIKQVAKETGVSYGGVLYVDSLSEQGGKVPTYLDLLDVTTSTIVQGFDKAKK